MTTTEKLREALQAVEPGWAAVDVAAVQKQASRVQVRRRIAGVVAAAAAVTLVVAIAPIALRHGRASMPTTAALGDTGPVPTVLTDAVRMAELKARTGPLPAVTRVGIEVVVPFGPGLSLQLRPPEPGQGTAGRICMRYEAAHCRPIQRSAGGWASGEPVSTVVGELNQVRAAAYWVVEAPVAGALAVAGGRPVPAAVRDLGQGYQLVSVRLPTALVESGSLSIADPESVWVFDARGQLVARHLQQ